MLQESENRNWLNLIGISILLFAILFQLSLDFNVIKRIADIYFVYSLSILIFALMLSIDLIRDYAYGNQQLTAREIDIRAKEIERKVMETDYSRKTKELDEARRLQIGMLPGEVPKLPYLDIAVYMKTATEVGGDYYDFNLTADGTLTIAIGDATGHGIKAGVMVALVKSLFNTMAHTFFIPDFFTHCTKMIRKMNFHNLYMCLMLVRITNHQIKVSAAGMPPLLIFRNENNQVEEMIVKGLPLGGPITARYDQKQAMLKNGDAILMMTDGYLDLFNPAMETFDLERVKEVFQQNGLNEPDDIIKALVVEGEKWRGKRQQDDDITFVLIKAIN
ncbi:MAG: SpoIIE family protein phosphatase [Calditrichaceae bacterium]